MRLLIVAFVMSASVVAQAAQQATTAQASGTESPQAVLRRCVNEAPTKITQCTTTYTNAVTASPSDLCPALGKLITCIGDTCNCAPDLKEAWQTAIRPYHDVFNNQKCQATFQLLKTAQWALGWGDPHYIKFDGNVITCNAAGEHVFAASDYWTITVNHKQLPTTNKTFSLDTAVIDKVVVSFFHPSAPTESFVFTPSAFPATSDANGVQVTSTGLVARTMGLHLTVYKFASHLAVGLVSLSANRGIVIDGCEAKTMDLKRSFSALETIPESCAALPAAFQQPCAYDAMRTNVSWAASAGASASEAKTTLTASADTETKKQTAPSGVAMTPTSVAVALMVVQAITAFALLL